MTCIKECWKKIRTVKLSLFSRHFIDTFLANNTTVVTLYIVATPTKEATRLIFFQDDSFVVNENFK